MTNVTEQRIVRRYIKPTLTKAGMLGNVTAIPVAPSGVQPA